MRVYLEDIINKKRARLNKDYPYEMSYIKAKCLENDKSFYDALSKPGLSIIGEIKKASPSKGLIRENFNYLEIAAEYEVSVDAISVLTEEDYFLGSSKYLKEVSENVEVPTLCKDFILTKNQIVEAKLLGASAVLLIVAILTDEQLKEYYQLATELGMDALIEVHTANEIKRALKVNPKIIGINNRNLDTFVTDVKTTVELRKLIPEGIIVVSESGIFGPDEIRKLNETNYDAVLIGESFMKSGSISDHSAKLRKQYELPQIKICGIKNEEEVKLINEFPVDYVGFIFVEKSKRFIKPSAARELRKLINDKKVVGVFQNHDSKYINEVISEVGLDIVQLHGSESSFDTMYIKAPVWKVISVEEKNDVNLYRNYENVEGILFDTKVKDQLGGTGKTFTWSYLDGINIDQKVILAGGLSSDNIFKAISTVKADILDLNSKLEVAGIKNRKKIEEVFKNIGGLYE